MTLAVNLNLWGSDYENSTFSLALLSQVFYRRVLCRPVYMVCNIYSSYCGIYSNCEDDYNKIKTKAINQIVICCFE